MLNSIIYIGGRTKPVASIEKELLAGMCLHRVCIEGLQNKQKEIDEKIAKAKKTADKDALKKLYEIRANIASALERAR